MAHEFFTVTQTGTTISATATSTAVAIPNASDGNKPRFIRVVATSQAYVKIGIAGVTATTNDFLVQNADSATLHVPSGITHIAAITSGGNALVNITPLENR